MYLMISEYIFYISEYTQSLYMPVHGNNWFLKVKLDLTSIFSHFLCQVVDRHNLLYELLPFSRDLTLRIDPFFVSITLRNDAYFTLRIAAILYDLQHFTNCESSLLYDLRHFTNSGPTAFTGTS